MHRWQRDPAEEPGAIVLEDPWLGKRAPAEPGRFHPVPDGFVSPRTRKAWLAEAVETERVELPGGLEGQPDLRDVSLVAWALVWIPA